MSEFLNIAVIVLISSVLIGCAVLRHDEVESGLTHAFQAAAKLDDTSNRTFAFPGNFFLERPARRNRYSPSGFDPAIKLTFDNASFNVSAVDNKMVTGRVANVTVVNRFDGVRLQVSNFDPLRVSFRVDVRNLAGSNDLTICGSFGPVLALVAQRRRINDGDLELLSVSSVSKDDDGLTFLHCCSADRFHCDASIESSIKAAAEFWDKFEIPFVAYVQEAWRHFEREQIIFGIRDFLRMQGLDIFRYEA